MKKILNLFLILILLFSLSACSNNNSNSTSSNIKNKIISVKANNQDKIVISTNNITSTATFVNYDLDGVIIQFVVVKGTDGKVRITYNTCASCSPSPNAYFKQTGEYVQCQNCGNKFHIDKIGESKDGCNPIPVDDMEQTANEITISKTSIENYKEKFENWNGPTGL
jgi:uncharacterized membrane protein